MNRLTATLITLNEEQALPRALGSLGNLADEIVVVDSGSIDRTCEVARHLGARVFTRPLTDFAEQRNFAAAEATHDWILALDGDEELSPELRDSLRAWKHQTPQAAAYGFPRRTNYLGRWIRHSGWYPDFKLRLYRRDSARFTGKVHEALRVNGPVESLAGELYHFPFRDLAEHALKIELYTGMAAEELLAEGRRSWRPAMLLLPPWTFLHKFVFQAGFFDGCAGWLIARMAARYVYLKYRKLGALLAERASQSRARDAEP